MRTRRLSAAVLSVASALVLSACSFTGINSYTLPFSAGSGGDAIVTTVYLENATNLVPNSEVKYREVTVGSVRKITLDEWSAKLVVGLDASANVPADVTAKVAQKSLLGAEYLELADPVETEDGAAPEAPADDSEVLLADGDVIGLDRTGRYPETEEVLSAASLLLNGGGLPQIQTIAREVNTALSGRTDTFNSLVAQISSSTGELEQQRGKIIDALEQIDGLTGTINDQTDVVSAALTSFPDGIESLDEEEAELAAALESLGSIATASRLTLGENAEATGDILSTLSRVTKALEQLGPKTHLLAENLVYPFQLNAFDDGGLASNGYANLYADISINAPELAENFLGIDALGKAFTGLLGDPTGPAGGTGDPFLLPIEAIPGGTDAADGIAKLLGLDSDRVSTTSGVGVPGAYPTPAATPGATPQPARPRGLLDLLLGGS